jgi:cytochrome c-type biogenesis protein CcmH
MKQILSIIFFSFVIFGSINAAEKAFDKNEQKRLDDILRGIKCVVCEGQSVASSDTRFAKSVRSIVKNMIIEGKNKSEIYGFIRGKYGDEVLFEPPMDSTTAILWITPFILIFLGFLFVVYKLKKYKK